ncbi:MAG: DoxX family membrane protein [Burkholderiales bacterium]|nr:DoxX family membrane protein [Burkholderiales bacterium]
MSTAVSLLSRAGRVYFRAEELADKLQSLFALAIRLYLARVFLLAAFTKLRDWDITLALFENEYRVPILSPAAAAFLGTAAELGLPLLLLAGFGTRAAALALFAFNAVAVISYPDLSDAGLKDHVLWGALMLVLAVYGPGRFSLDRFLSR